MQSIKYSTRIFTMAALLTITAATGCKKLLELDPKVGTLVTPLVFASNEQAESAMIGVYTKLINGANPNMSYGDKGFAMGATSLVFALSADEYQYGRTDQANFYKIYTSKLNKEENGSVSSVLWNSAYDCIYGCNAILEGIDASTAQPFTQAMRTQLKGESKFLRAFSYFNLVNMFGDLPLALTIDFNTTRSLSRAPVDKVYEQIIADLNDAVRMLPEEYPSRSGGRIRANKAVAKALLARVSLYRKDYEQALGLANDVIGETGKYWLEADLNNAFTTQSHEAIWQLQHATVVSPRYSATPEGATLMGVSVDTANLSFFISTQLLNAFEAGDRRKVDWIRENTYDHVTRQIPFKYKKGEGTQGSSSPDEYSTPIRLSELLLIRAEALLLGPAADKNAALDDVNEIRRRAGLTTPLPYTLSNDEVLQAIMHERQVELFGEWGHRYFDLKRTGKATAVLSAIPAKQPWLGDYQLLFPLPMDEISRNPNLKQNPQY